MLTEKIKLDPDEKVLKVVRKHWFILLAQTIGPVIFALIPCIALAYGFNTDMFDRLSESIVGAREVALFAVSAWVLLMWMMIFTVWTDYYLDMWTITTKRVIAVDQQGLFHRSISSFRFERLQDLNIHIRGIIATALNFGTLEAETASQDEHFTIHGVPRPRDIKALIQDAADQTLVYRSGENATGVDGA